MRGTFSQVFGAIQQDSAEPPLYFRSGNLAGWFRRRGHDPLPHEFSFPPTSLNAALATASTRDRARGPKSWRTRCRMTDYKLLTATDETNSGRGKKTDDVVFTISQISKQFGVSLRTLRFYESRGLIKPNRQGGRRLYRQPDVDLLGIILKAKKLGFSLAECGQLITDGASRHTLKLSRGKCLEQIGILERKLAEITEALTELRRIYTTYIDQ
jgi:DNA-binding transcriptional MerR regulator